MSMKGIMFRDLKKQYQVLKNDIDRVVLDVMARGQFIGGTLVSELERVLANYVGVRHCVSCANGTDALLLALIALGIGPDDAVFIPDFTFFATGEIIPTLGATPIFVDVDPKTFNIDPDSLERAIQEVNSGGEKNPAVVITVDLFGLPADYQRIMKVAEAYGLKVIEDAAQGFGGAVGDKRACSFGDIATTSFFPAKPLGCYGDGGAIFTDDDEIACVITSLKEHGKGSYKYDNVRIGMNSRLDTLQAGVLMVKFQAFVDYEHETMGRIHNQYSAYLSDFVEVPLIPPDFRSGHAQYTITLKNRQERDRLKQYLEELGIPTMIYYPKPMHKQSAFRDIGKELVDLSVSSKLCEKVLSLPMHPYLENEEIGIIANAVKAGINDEYC